MYQDGAAKHGHEAAKVRQARESRVCGARHVRGFPEARFGYPLKKNSLNKGMKRALRTAINFTTAEQGFWT